MNPKPATLPHASEALPPELKPLIARIYLSTAAAVLLHGVKNALLIYVLLFFAAVGLAKFKDAEKFPAVSKTIAFQKRLEAGPLAAVKRTVPTDFNDRDVSGWMLYGGAYVLSLVVGLYADKASARRDKLKKERKTLLDARQAAKPELLKKAEALKAGKLDRSQLLELIAESQKALEAHKRQAAFLSIDVVDSTGMKLGEDAGVAERDFRQYKEMVQRILSEKNSLKSAWTPDGVMICFATAEDAVRAAQAVISSLGLFNKNVKAIKRDFRIRAGINSGEVLFDDKTPMEEMADRVIDVAGHMQKHGIPDGIAISKHSVEPLLGKYKFADAKRSVDGFPVFEWTEALEG